MICLIWFCSKISWAIVKKRIQSILYCCRIRFSLVVGFHQTSNYSSAVEVYLGVSKTLEVPHGWKNERSSYFFKMNCSKPDNLVSRAGLPEDDEEKIQNGVLFDGVGELDEIDTEALKHQIAGHTRIGVLKHRLGYVLKPVQKMPLGEREVNFYKDIFRNNENNCNATCLSLQRLIPGFHGVASLKGENQTKTEYLMLDDVVQGFSRPCIIDIKIGKETWDPLAPPEKVEHEKTKYWGTKNKFGISITGMQFYDIKEKLTFKCEKEWGKSLTESSMYSALRNFLNSKVNVEKCIAEVILKKLMGILNLFEIQTEYLFYSSSLLIAYDGKYVEEKIYSNPLKRLNEGSEEQIENWLRIRMIDFAHVFPANGRTDSNYLFGLKNTIHIFSNIFQNASNEKGDGIDKDF